MFVDGAIILDCLKLIGNTAFSFVISKDALGGCL